MVSAQPAQGSEPGKGLLIAACVVGAALVIAAIVSFVRSSALEKQGNSAAQGAGDNAGAAVAISALLPQEEIDRQHAQYQPPAPVIAQPVPNPPVAIPVNQNSDEVILQKEKAKVNQRIVERMKEYVKDHPNLDTRELQEQIIKRESGGRPRSMRKSHEKK